MSRPICGPLNGHLTRLRRVEAEYARFRELFMSGAGCSVRIRAPGHTMDFPRANITEVEAGVYAGQPIVRPRIEMMVYGGEL